MSFFSTRRVPCNLFVLLRVVSLNKGHHCAQSPLPLYFTIYSTWNAALQQFPPPSSLSLSVSVIIIIGGDPCVSRKTLWRAALAPLEN